MRYIFSGALVVFFLGGFYFGTLLGKPSENPQEKMSLEKKSEMSNEQEVTMNITSRAFKENETIPVKYTCDGENSNPPLSFEGVPKNTKSLALVVDDPDIPESVKNDRGIEVFDHWVVFGIPPETTTLKEGAIPPGSEGQNSAGKSEYMGPCPPDGEHRYFFKLYALDVPVNLPPQATKEDLEEMMAGHILDKAELIGLYNRQ
ncbi:MAG: YbhB/YbcL family Raf kinase inhibitor-like protein [Candidatus Paceibacterota bacterium]